MIRYMRGKGESLYVSEEVLRLAKQVGRRLGLSKSGLYRYCLLHTLQELGVLSEILKEVELK